MIGGPGTTIRRSQVCLAATVTSLKVWIEASIVGVDISGGSVTERMAESSGGSYSSSGACSPWAQYQEEASGKLRPDIELMESPELRMEKPSRSKNLPLKQGCDRRELTKPTSRAARERPGSITNIVKGEAKTARTSDALQAKLRMPDSSGGSQEGPGGKNPF
ncbi:hypothetical protein VNO77_19159 [Canavalia gladiata]|uniref:Uncharacterized protein n=1 Tax=Canavalia gladiata TaxID=3824 RepID=A0AAN9LLY1_CANGL